MNIVIVGAGAAGVNAAKKARRIDEKANITLIDENKFINYSKVSIPLYASGEIKKLESIYSDNDKELIDIYNIKILAYHKVLDINKEEKKISVKNIDSDRIFDIKYNKIILAPGFSFSMPKILPKKVNNAFALNSLSDAVKIREFIEKTAVKDLTIFGYNYYSVITASRFLKQGFNVTIIDKKDFTLEYFDDEFNFLINSELEKNKVKLIRNQSVIKFFKNDKERISKIQLSNDAEIHANLLIFFDNVYPNVELAKKSGVMLGEATGKIKVNEKMETSVKDIFACGSAVDVINYLSKTPCRPISVNTAVRTGRTAGSGIFERSDNFCGTLCLKIIIIENYCAATCGINKHAADALGINAATLTVFSGEHERLFSNNEKFHIKITINKDNKKIIGAQIFGNSKSIDKRIDHFSTIIYAGLTIEDLANMDFCYLPELNIQKNPINTLGMIAKNIDFAVSNSVPISKVVKENTLIIDIRSKSEYIKSHVENALNIPLTELRKRINELPKDKKIYLYDSMGMKGYIAERMLRGNGMENVYNIEGGLYAIKLYENIN